MTTSVRLEAILIKEPLTHAKIASINRLLAKWGGRVLSRLQRYPPQRPTRYVRTGDLGRGWNMRTTTRKDDLAVEVGNGVFYARFVQGFQTEDPRQTKVMRDRNWPSAEQVAKAEWGRIRRDIERELTS